MLNLLVEGIGSLRFGCTVAFLLPAIGPVLAARHRAVVPAVGFAVLAGLVGWARFGDWWPGPPATSVLVLAAAIAVGLLLIAVRTEEISWLVATTAVVSVLAGWLWVPCVGEHFSEPLNNASTERLRSLWQVLVYVAGIAAPLFAMAALPVAIPRLARIRDHQTMPWIGLACTAIVGVAIATGLYGEVAVRFAPSAG